jgi:class 3 adenylate cyclase/tetratricopeptide (TPR) repeat protein
MWRRRVLQVAIPYSVGGWLLVQVAEVILDAFEAPPWIMQGLLIVLLIGFPITVVLAWVFDITPSHEIIRTKPLEPVADEPEPEEIPEPAPAVSVEMGDSERRQVTMLNAILEFQQGDDPEIDPEFLRESIAAFQAVSRELAQRFHAHTLSSGAEELHLVFGYPTAQDDDARRAVAASLSLLEQVSGMHAGRVDPDAPGLAARVGISTGLVVVEESGGDRDVTIIGQAPRMATWLQGLARSGAVVIGPHTQRLVANHYQLESLGVQPKTPFGSDLDAFEVVSAATAGASLVRPDHLSGREDEMRLLQDRWENVTEGGGQFVVLQGEPGIGKSSLLGTFVEQVREAGDAALITCLCSPYEQTSPLAPIIQVLRSRVLRFEEQDSPQARGEKLKTFVADQSIDSEEAVPLLASLLSLEAGAGIAPPSGSAQIVRVQTMELLLDIISLYATNRPLLLVFEDLHWADPSTLEMIQMMVDRGPAAGLFVLFSVRPGFEEEWVRRSYVHVQELLPLSRRAARELMAETATGAELPDELVKRIIDETDGNPLFIQELTLAVLESDAWRSSVAEGKPAGITQLKIPATLQDSLAARVDNLGEGKSLLQLCAVLGREFSYDLLKEVSGTENEAALKEELSRIVRSELLFQRGVLRNQTYSFKHILIQETAYNSLLKSKRRELHGRTAEILERTAAEGGRLEPALLAWHFTRAGNAAKAIPLWTRASRRSLSGFANQEAIEQSQQGISLLQSLPESPERAAGEIALQAIAGTALLSTYGYVDPRVRKVFTRALELCEQIGDAPQLFQVAVGLWMYYIIASQLDEAYDIGQRLLRIAEQTGEPAQHLQARYCIAFVHYYRADYLTAKAHLDRAMADERDDCDYAAQSASGDDTRIHVRVLLAVVSWHLGLTDTGLKLVQEANDIATRVKHPWGITFAAFYTSWFHQMREEPDQTLARADQAASIAEENGFRFWLPLVNFMRAWAGNREPGSPDEPLEAGAAETMKQCLELYRGIGAAAGLTYLSLRLAEEYVGLGQREAATEELDRARLAMEQSGEIFFRPEHPRLLGRIQMLEYGADNAPETLENAGRLYRQAIDDARKLESKGLELKAALDYADVLVLQERPGEALQLLAGIHNRFQEKDTSDDGRRLATNIKKLKKTIEKAE